MHLEAPIRPAPELLLRGPLDPSREPGQAKSEKWCELELVVPVPTLAVAGLVRHSFEKRGPFTIPMAVRRAGASAGAKDAWIFFTHPLDRFPREASFWNAASTKPGVLGARLVRFTNGGVQFFDEVGVAKDADPVTASLAQAIGTLRARTLGRVPWAPYAADILRLELDLLEAFRILSLCTRTDSGVNALAEVHAMLQRRNVAPFLASAFGDEDLKAIDAAVRARNDGSYRSDSRRFRIERGDFVKAVDVKDGGGRQVVAELANEWQKLKAEPEVERLEKEIAECVAEDEKLAAERAAPRTGFSRLLNTGERITKKIDVRRLAVAARRAELEDRLAAIPGYARVRGVAGAIADFENVVKGVERLATNVFDANVAQRTLSNMGSLVDAFEDAESEQARSDTFRRYHLQLRAEVLPRIFGAYSVAAYVLRRPDAVSDRGRTRTNMLRICRLAEDLIGYLRGEPYLDKTLGDAFEETWGQIRALEAQALGHGMEA